LAESDEGPFACSVLVRERERERMMGKREKKKKEKEGGGGREGGLRGLLHLLLYDRERY